MFLHSGDSLDSMKVHIVLEQLGVEYDYPLHSLGQGALNNDEYRKVDPNAKIPALRDGELQLDGSGAITGGAAPA